MSAHEWKEELAALFAARANPALQRKTLRELARLADDLLPDASGYDIDIADLIRFAVALADSRDADALDLEPRARRAAAAAFLHAGITPNSADRELIAQGNGKNYNGDPHSKQARDTWAYMTYKRTKHDDRRRFYSYKPGAERRTKFRDALITAVAQTVAHPDA